jgi:hypothetical protein
MSNHIQFATRRLFLASLVLFFVSLVFSVTNVVTVFSAPPRTVSVPTGVGFEGYLLDAVTGQPLSGQHTLTFNLYSAASGGSALSGWSTNVYANVPVNNGFYSVLLTGLPVSGFTGDRWLGVTVDSGSEISPRTRIGSVPFALNAEVANEVAWGDISGMPAGFSDGTDHQVGSGAPASNGAVGRVPVFDSTTSIAGASGLTYTSNLLTVSNNLSLNGSIQQSTSLGARVYHNANQSISNDTSTALAFNSERWDTNLIHDTATNNTRLTAKTAGTYLIGGGIYFAAEDTGYRQITVKVTFAAGGSKTIATHSTDNLGSTIANVLTIDTVYNLAVNDYVELLVRQNSGASLTVYTDGSNAYTPEFYLVRLP